MSSRGNGDGSDDQIGPMCIVFKTVHYDAKTNFRTIESKISSSAPAAKMEVLLLRSILEVMLPDCTQHLEFHICTGTGKPVLV
ncbi:ABC transporter G family member 3-like [Dorcoceras hygrometricum]|uniref:ABC transporter G family member 3-like n=1 Tax=Dorcoceras hygrometricum TaxID=472368 RepID=A0A2Z7AAA3_9LAMI|nr:ABC transporter G family member 3-like [Dorcoceras hygrometricum]